MDPIYNKTVFSTQYRESHLMKTGGHLPADVAKLTGSADSLGSQGLTVWEMGNLIEVPFESEQSQGKTMHLWTVVRVLQHTTVDKTKSATQQKQADGGRAAEPELNLSSDDSLSAASLEEDEDSDDVEAMDEDTIAARATLEMSNFRIN